MQWDSCEAFVETNNLVTGWIIQASLKNTCTVHVPLRLVLELLYWLAVRWEVIELEDWGEVDRWSLVLAAWRHLLRMERQWLTEFLEQPRPCMSPFKPCLLRRDGRMLTLESQSQSCTYCFPSERLCCWSPWACPALHFAYCVLWGWNSKRLRTKRSSDSVLIGLE